MNKIKRAITIFSLVGILSLGVGCSADTEQVEEPADAKEIVSENISTSKLYNPVEDGIFMEGTIKQIDTKQGTYIVTSGDIDYTVKTDKDTIFVFAESKDLSIGQRITVRFQYVEEGAYELNAIEIQNEDYESDIEVRELNNIESK